MVDSGEAVSSICIQRAHLKQVRLRRFLSGIVDGFIIFGLILPISFLLGMGLSALDIVSSEIQITEGWVAYFFNSSEGKTLSLSFLEAAYWLSIILAIIFQTGYSAWLTSTPRNATWGQRLCGVRTWQLVPHPSEAFLWRPSFLRGAMHCLLCSLCGLSLWSLPIFLISFFAPRKRCLHDILAGIVVLRDVPDLVPSSASEASPTPVPLLQPLLSEA